MLRYQDEKQAVCVRKAKPKGTRELECVFHRDWIGSRTRRLSPARHSTNIKVRKITTWPSDFYQQKSVSLLSGSSTYIYLCIRL